MLVDHGSASKHLPEPDVFSDMNEVTCWLARNNSRPGRLDRGETVVIPASPTWTRTTEDLEPDLVAEEI